MGLLWAYKTSLKMAIRFSLFYLIFEKEALLPMEVEIPAVKALEKSNIVDVKDALSIRILYL